MTESQRGRDKDSGRTRDLRIAADVCCLWRLCGNARCHRAKACRGAPHRCARNAPLLPEGVRDFFVAFLAAKQACIPFEDFKDAMEDRDETKAYFAWRAGTAFARE